MFGKKRLATKPFRPDEWLQKTDLESILSSSTSCALIEMDKQNDIPCSFRFNYKRFEQTLTVASLLGNDYDVDRAWLTAGFPADAAVDLPFVNRFNNFRGLACASIDENGASVLHAHFPLAGLKKRYAELMLWQHIGSFEQELARFNTMRNERHRSASVN